MLHFTLAQPSGRSHNRQLSSIKSNTKLETSYTAFSPKVNILLNCLYHTFGYRVDITCPSQSTSINEICIMDSKLL